jgi:hypothetical protein
MTTKTSQKTEDMLDQTFANFDSEVTGAQTQTHDAGGASAQPAKKNNNMMLFVGMGVAAVGLLGYMFVLKPMLAGDAQPQQQQQQVAQQAPVTPTPEAAQTPVAPVAPVETAQAPVVPVAPVDNAQVQQAPVAPTATPVEVAQVPVIPASSPVAPVAPVETAQAPIVPVAPVVNAQVQQAPEVKVDVKAPTNQQVAVAVVDELKVMFEQQSNEFKTVLTDIDGRVSSIETALTEQKNINQKVDERLTALESKKPVKVSKSEVKSEGGVNVATEKKVVKKSVAKKVETKKEVNEDSSVLVDKSSDSPKAKAEKEVNALPKVEFHSIYGGRVWLKNTDGSLSTFSSGDRLPSGEVIKSINDENFEVVTNKRTIRN